MESTQVPDAFKLLSQRDNLMFKIKQKSGQVAIMLVLILTVLVTITTAAVAVGITSTRDTTSLVLGEEASIIAESGADNAVLHLMRDPNYVGEANLPIGDGSATIVVTGTSQKTITSTGTISGMVKTVEVVVDINNGVITITNWREI